MLRYAIIGCGVAAKVHLHYLQHNPAVKIVALCDPSPTITPEFQELRLPIYQDYREMLEKEQLDAVTIASPHYLHYEQIIACARGGIHIMCEKPLAITVLEAQAAVAECKKNKVKLAVMLQRRFFNNTVALKKVIESHALGEIISIRYDLNVNKTKEYYRGWRGKKKLVGGGVLLCQGLHDLDRIVHCFGKPKIISSVIKTTRDYIDVEDEAKAQLEFPGNIKFQIAATANAPTLWSGKISIIGEKGSILLDSEKVLEWNVPEIAAPPMNEKKNRDFVPAYYDPCHEENLEDFIQSIMQDKEPLVNGESTLPGLQVLYEIYERSKL